MVPSASVHCRYVVVDSDVVAIVVVAVDVVVGVVVAVGDNADGVDGDARWHSLCLLTVLLLLLSQ